MDGMVPIFLKNIFDRHGGFERRISSHAGEGGLRMVDEVVKYPIQSRHETKTLKEMDLMKKTGTKLALIVGLLLIGALTALADGKDLKDTISIAQETVINETKLKPGAYEVRFDADAGEVSILKGKQVIATVKATARDGEKPVRKTETYFSNTDKGLALTKLVFKGDDRAIILDHGSTTASR